MRIAYLRLGTAAVLLAGAVAAPATSAAPAVPCGGTSGLSAAPWSHDFGTGEDYGVPHAVTTVDPQWVIAPGNGPTYSVTPNSSWVTHPNANWINDKPTASGSGGGTTVLDVDARRVTAPYVDGSAVYDTLAKAGVPTAVSLTALPTTTVFRHYFTVPQNSYGHSISLSYAADNGVDFYLDGQPNYIGGFNPPVPSSGIPLATPFNQLHSLSWAGALSPGTHYLDAVVTDYGVAKGLLVIGAAKGCVVKVPAGTCVTFSGGAVYTYSPAPYDLGTGESGHVPFPPTTVDDDWTTVAPVAGPAYAVATYPGWVGSTTASWINSQPSATRGLYGTHTYAVQFPLGSGAYNTLLDIRYAADNGVDFYLNGLTPANYIGGYNPGPLPQVFNQMHSLTWSGAGFVNGGTNTLYAVVTDYGVATGLLVEGGVRSCEKGPLP